MARTIRAPTPTGRAPPLPSSLATSPQPGPRPPLADATPMPATRPRLASSLRRPKPAASPAASPTSVLSPAVARVQFGRTAPLPPSPAPAEGAGADCVDASKDCSTSHRRTLRNCDTTFPSPGMPSATSNTPVSSKQDQLRRRNTITSHSPTTAPQTQNRGEEGFPEWGRAAPPGGVGAPTPRASTRSARRPGNALQRLNRNLAAGAPMPAPSTARASGSQAARDEAWLMQRQLEVELSLRKKLASNEDIKETRRTVETIVKFFDELRRVSDKLQLSQGVVFQDLLSRLAPGTNVNFDKQGGSGAVPMHQAKVLDRRVRLEDGEVSCRVQTYLGAQYLEELMQPLRDLRALVRVKVEDSNDVHMAEDCVRATGCFLTTLNRYSKEKGLTEYTALENLRTA
mmetsp:Transcript_47801/g.88949  ORF Transcript_47801/g.88949 Transcript_47801/m.88949 type:complete len:400 (+) Transcript_47801:263-1462(+)